MEANRHPADALADFRPSPIAVFRAKSDFLGGRQTPIKLPVGPTTIALAASPVFNLA